MERLSRAGADTRDGTRVATTGMAGSLLHCLYMHT